MTNSRYRLKLLKAGKKEAWKIRHPVNTRIIFASSGDEAREKYKALKVESKDPGAILECFKASEVEDFEMEADFNFVGEISVSPEVMAEIRTDPDRAYVLYLMEDAGPDH